MNRERASVALLLDYMNLHGGSYESRIRDCFDARCRSLDIDLAIFYGRAVDDTLAGTAAHNAIYDLARAQKFDGVVILTTLLASHSGVQRVQQLVERMGDLATCCVGAVVGELPSVLVDGTLGLGSTIEHLIVEHGKRHLVFVAGTPSNPESDARYGVFRQVLARHGLDSDPRRVVRGDFVRSGGYDAISQLLDAGIEFDAIVAANDHMAEGAIEALRHRGLRVPVDVAVTGFDDIEVAGTGNPPLTTVAQPFEQIAEAAIELVLRQLAGEAVPKITSLPGQAVIRRSCGCGFRYHVAASLPPGASESDDREQGFQAKLAKCLGGKGKPATDLAQTLLAAVKQELAGQSQRFVGVLESLLQQPPPDLDGTRGLRDAVVLLREEFRTVANEGLEDLWHDARDLIALAETTWQANERMHMAQTNSKLLLAGERLGMAIDRDSLRKAVLDSLPGVDIPTACVSLFSEASPGQLQAFAVVVDGHERQTSDASYRADQIVPPGAFPSEARTTLVVFPLVFESHGQGVAVFEYRKRVLTYPMVRDQISAALKSVSLKEELVQKTLLHERSVQERLATMKRMQALSVLAGGVAHDLNNTLGPLVGLPDLLLMQLEALGLPEQQLAGITADIASIKSAAQRTSQTVKNLLTLGRRGRTTKELLDLSNVVKASVLREVPGEGSVAVRFEGTSEPLVVHAAEAQIERAMTNLVRNAIEATVVGEVEVRATAMTLDEPLRGYELVGPGSYALIQVIDRGSGIAPFDLPRVFEPFFSRKRAGERSGSGLGLSIVHSVVKEHDGFVDVTSELGRGTCFSIYIPTANGTVARQIPERQTPPGRARILIVDDEPSQLLTASRLLGHLGYEVDTAASNQTALEAFVRALNAQAPYDLVVLDVILGEDADGLELYEQMCEVAPRQRAVLVSGHAPRERMELAAARGVPWLPKPYTIETLSQAVRDNLPNLRCP